MRIAQKNDQNKVDIQEYQSTVSLGYVLAFLHAPGKKSTQPLSYSQVVYGRKTCCFAGTSG